MKLLWGFLAEQAELARVVQKKLFTFKQVDQTRTVLGRKTDHEIAHPCLVKPALL